MKSLKKILIGIFVLALVGMLFTGCQESSGGIAVEGTWTLDSSGTSWTSLERWTITDLSVTYETNWGSGYSTVYEADIVRYDNSGLNGGDTEIYSGGSTTDPGHAVICYTSVDGDGTGEVDKYQVFRWATNESDASLRDFTQGYNNVGSDYPDNVNEVFDTADLAEAGATNAAGHFTSASEGASKE